MTLETHPAIVEAVNRLWSDNHSAREVGRIITAAVRKVCEPLERALEDCRVAARVNDHECRCARIDAIASPFVLHVFKDRMDGTEVCARCGRNVRDVLHVSAALPQPESEVCE